MLFQHEPFLGNEFSEPAIALRSQKPGLGKLPALGFFQARFDQHTLADSVVADIVSHRRNMAADIDSLDTWETKRFSGPASVYGPCIAFGLPSCAGIDVRVVDAGRTDLNDDIIWRRLWHR